ncbi:MAG TPA: DUF929 family protein, partial [Acidimicrobiales bacterium]|nr:DUF929 family protein [Acidimicrobiales bacterium]
GSPGPGQGQRPQQKPGQRPQQKPGQRPPSAARRPPSAKPGAGAGGRVPQKGGGGGGRPPAGGRRPGTAVPAGPPRRFSATTMAFTAIVVVVLVVVALVVVKVTSGSGGSGTGNCLNGVCAPVPTKAPPGLVSEVTNVPASVEQAVGVPSSSLVGAPSYVGGQSPLTSGGKPEALFIGAEFCPYCAAERWAMIVAFSRFGTFSNLYETTSSPWDDPSAIPTFTFHYATYTSSYVDFTMVEHESNDKDGLGTRSILEPLTTEQNDLWSTYDSKFGEPEGFPFLDMGNKVIVYSPSYNPEVLSGYTQSAIAAQLTNPKSTITQSIVGTANYLTAGICAITGQQPASVCSASAVTAAAKTIGIPS